MSPSPPPTPSASLARSLLRSPLGSVTNVSQRIAEIDKARAQVPGEEADVFSQDDQLEQSAPPPSTLISKPVGAGSNVAAQKQKKTKGKQATSEESSSTVAKQVELSVAITLPSSTNGAKGKSAKPISKDSMLRCAKDTEYTVFKSKVVASALNAGLSASTYDNLDIEGKIAAGGVWKDKKRLHDDEAFRSFWEKILKKKSWEAYVYVSQSPTAVIEVSSDSGPDIAPVKVEDDSTDDDEVAKSLLAAAALDLKKKRKSNEAPNVSGKRPKVVVKDEAEEARKKSAADILRRHTCTKHGSKACFILRGGVHLPVDNEMLDRWIAAIERDSGANTAAHLPSDKYIDKKVKEAYTKHELRASPSRPENSASPADYMLDSDFDEELPLPLPASQMPRFRRSLNPSAASGPSRLRRASPFPPQASTSAAQPTQARAGPDMTFEALAKRVKLYETIVAKLLKVGVKKASAFARLTEDKLKQVGCLEGEVEEALDAQDRWRRLDAKDLKADELVDALLA
ncbi:unnamed protein product [Tilletia caries]|uniref:Uncharacterized protein n=1 Tax=Tilletia caries TaxID=13290 RepID=A0A8T8SW74_9BASI|nr:hypothetical protein A4X03_0g6614 [Tilletia caries]CAD6925732.1 unnamed protein product [Tilletia caries]CAD6936960.1 unnamed protein product [Tilletia caries]CAD7063384.1 unnamed protein product [Tilletia caries]